MIENVKSIGFKDMHPMQTEALMDLIVVTLNLAAKPEDLKQLANVESDCDELVKLFGGAGVSVTVKSH